MAIAGREAKIDLGRIFQRGFDTLGRNLLAYAGLALLLGVAPALVDSYALERGAADFDLGLFATPLYLAGVLLEWVCGALLQATLIRAMILGQRGRPADPAGSLAAAIGLVPALIGLSILSGLLVLAGFILLVVPGFIAWAMMSVAVPVLVEERTGVVDSMARSQELTKGSRWRILALLLIVTIVTWLLGATTALLAVTGDSANLWIRAGTSALASGAAALLNALLLSSLYIELRTVKEGASVEGLAEIFE
jgi:hypothetical protein